MSFSGAADLDHDVPILQEVHYFVRPSIVLRRVFGMLLPPLASRLGGTFGKESLRAALRGAELMRIAVDGGKLSFHDCTLLLTRTGRTPYLVRCVAEISVGRPFAS